jgi:hypothetical protein
VKQITLRYLILPDGRVEERVEGIQGEACRALTERVEASLGSLQRQISTAEGFQLAATGVQQAQPQHQPRMG